MGSGVSSENNKGESLEAFKACREEYDNVIVPLIESGAMTEVEAMIKLTEQYTQMVNMHSGPNGEKIAHSLSKHLVESTMEAPLDRYVDADTNQVSLKVGDVVKAKDKGFYFEGVVMQIKDGKVLVNFGDDVISDDMTDIEKEFAIEDCYLVMTGLELEEDDRVEVNTIGFLFCQGTIVNIHRHFNQADSSVSVTYDVHMDNEDHEDDNENGDPDMELNVPSAKIRKIISHRVSAAERWHRGVRKVTAMLAFQKMGALRHPLTHKPPAAPTADSENVA